MASYPAKIRKAFYYSKVSFTRHLAFTTKIDNKMNEAKAHVILGIWVLCPDCMMQNEIIQEANNQRVWTLGNPVVEKCKLEIDCKFCDESFIVTSISF